LKVKINDEFKNINNLLHMILLYIGKDKYCIPWRKTNDKLTTQITGETATKNKNSIAPMPPYFIFDDTDHKKTDK